MSARSGQKFLITSANNVYLVTLKIINFNLNLKAKRVKKRFCFYY